MGRRGGAERTRRTKIHGGSTPCVRRPRALAALPRAMRWPRGRVRVRADQRAVVHSHWQLQASSDSIYADALGPAVAEASAASSLAVSGGGYTLAGLRRSAPDVCLSLDLDPAWILAWPCAQTGSSSSAVHRARWLMYFPVPAVRPPWRSMRVQLPGGRGDALGQHLSPRSAGGCASGSLMAAARPPLPAPPPSASLSL